MYSEFDEVTEVFRVDRRNYRSRLTNSAASKNGHLVKLLCKEENNNPNYYYGLLVPPEILHLPQSCTNAFITLAHHVHLNALDDFFYMA